MTQYLLFTAKWCGPCRLMKPLIASVDTSNKITTIDIEDDVSTTNKYGVKSVPMLLKVVDDDVVDTISGRPSQDQLIAFLQ